MVLFTEENSIPFTMGSFTNRTRKGRDFGADERCRFQKRASVACCARLKFFALYVFDGVLCASSLAMRTFGISQKFCMTVWSTNALDTLETLVKPFEMLSLLYSSLCLRAAQFGSIVPVQFRKKCHQPDEYSPWSIRFWNECGDCMILAWSITRSARSCRYLKSFPRGFKLRH